MSLSAEALYKMSYVELLAACVEARRQFVDKKFARDTHRARLAWIKAKMFVGSSGGVTERNMAIDVSEEIARKGQELREVESRAGRRQYLVPGFHLYGVYTAQSWFSDHVATFAVTSIHCR